MSRQTREADLKQWLGKCREGGEKRGPKVKKQTKENEKDGGGRKQMNSRASKCARAVETKAQFLFQGLLVIISCNHHSSACLPKQLYSEFLLVLPFAAPRSRSKLSHKEQL